MSAFLVKSRIYPFEIKKDHSTCTICSSESWISGPTQSATKMSLLYWRKRMIVSYEIWEKYRRIVILWRSYTLLTSEVQAVFQNFISTKGGWISDATKAIANEKIENIARSIGYPDSILDDKLLEEEVTEVLCTYIKSITEYYLIILSL